MVPRRVLIALSFLFVALAASAQPARVFVSTTGLDHSPCTRQWPCRNFAAAMGAVADGGEIVVLDSAGYGPVVVTKSVSIVAPPGVYAGITNAAGPAVSINVANADVVLRGLTLNGMRGANSGVNALAVRRLRIENCTISGFMDFAVDVGSTAVLFIRDSLIADNLAGVLLDTPAGLITGAIDRSRIDGNGQGALRVVAHADIYIRDSTFMNNGLGPYAEGGEMHLENCTVINNFRGVSSVNGANVTISGSTVAGNVQYGLINVDGTLTSFGNNVLTGNGTDHAGTITPGPMH